MIIDPKDAKIDLKDKQFWIWLGVRLVALAGAFNLIDEGLEQVLGLHLPLIVEGLFVVGGSVVAIWTHVKSTKKDKAKDQTIQAMRADPQLIEKLRDN